MKLTRRIKGRLRPNNGWKLVPVGYYRNRVRRKVIDVGFEIGRVDGFRFVVSEVKP